MGELSQSTGHKPEKVQPAFLALRSFQWDFHILLWKRACEGSQVFKVHQGSFLNSAMRITGQRESDF